MRWLLSAHGASPFGGERVLLAMAGGLAERGHDVTVELPHDGPAVELASELEGVEVWVSGRPRLPRDAREALRYVLGLARARRSLAARMRERRYDVVWVHSIYNPVAALAARRAQLPVVWHLHERNLPGPAGLAMSGTIRFAATRAVAISEFVRRSFPALSGRVSVLSNPLLRSIEATPPRRGNPFTLLYVGQFEPQKRVPDLVAAVGAVPDSRLVLVGGGKAARGVEDAIRRLGLAERVELAGVQLDVRPHLADCDAVVIPSRNEGFGLVALEAMAAGRPVVAARSGALPEVLGDAALYFPIGDVDGLAASIRRLRDEPPLGDALRRRGLERVARFGRAGWLDGVERIAREVVELRGTSAARTTIAPIGGMP